MEVLILAAHPDDEVLAMGGTIMMHRNRGDNVSVVFLATGISARYIDDDNTYRINMLRKDSKRALEVLKVSNIFYEDYPDNRIDNIPFLIVVKKVEKYITKIKPDIVYTHNLNELNIDHKLVHNAVITATRPFKNKVKALFSFSVPEANIYNIPFNFSPNYFVNIEKTIEYKIKALKMYKSEFRQFPHVRSLSGVKSVATYYGFFAGFKYAEPFILQRQFVDRFE